MPWARIDDLLPVHPKVRSLSDAAFRLYISAICWCNLNTTDGHVPSDQLRYISDVRRPAQCADQLVDAGLWEKNGIGWVIHDYLTYQPSAEKVKRERQLKSQRQARWRSGDASTEPSTNHSGDASTVTSLVRARQHPIPSPDGSVGIQSSGSSELAADERLIQAVKQAIADRTRRGVTADQARAIAAQIIGSETVRNAEAYVVSAINRDPNPRRFLPTSQPPPIDRTPPRPDQDEINARGRERARQLLAAAIAEAQPEPDMSPIERAAWDATHTHARELP